jgi:hypothetical protein
MTAVAVKKQNVIVEELMQPLENVAVREQIAALAYTLWQQRGCPDDSPDEDWFRAEQELLSRAEESVRG